MVAAEDLTQMAPLVKSTKLERRARRAAADLLRKHKNQAAIEEADYLICSFIFEAARLALEDEELAQRIGERMKQPR